MTQAAALAAYGSSSPSNRNRIINGDMRIDQRNAGAAVTLNTWNGQFPVDRFRGNVRPSIGTISAQQSTVVPSGQDFSNSLKLTQASVTTQAANDVYSFLHVIEGYNAQSFQFGTSGAKELVLSFWVRSSVTGTYCVSFYNSSLNRSLVKEYTISVADTWQKINISFSADSTGTWLINNSVGLYVSWDLGSGTDYQTTPNSWASGEHRSSANQVRWIDTNGATFYITGVQLEAGSVATPFEHVDYSEMLRRCQRYFQKSYAQETVEGSSTSVGVRTAYAFDTGSLQRSFVINANFLVTMRAQPTMAYWDSTGTSGVIARYDASSSKLTVTASSSSRSDSVLGGYLTTSPNATSGAVYQFHYTASAEL